MMTGFTPVTLNQFVKQYLRNNQGADGESVRAGVEDALAAWRQGVRCACGSPLWVAGSAVAGYGCFRCITGTAEPNGDPEIDAACDPFLVDMDNPDERFARVNEIIRNHPLDFRDRLEEIGFEWQDDDHDLLYEEEMLEERSAVARTTNQRRLVHFLQNGGVVTRQILNAYLDERYAEQPNLPLIRKYFKQANPHLKSILLAGLAANPTDLDLLDDLAYFSEFDSMLGELIAFYTEACVRETDMERFSMLVQDFHINTCEQGFDAFYELAGMFRSGAKCAVVQQLSESIDDFEGLEEIPF